MSKIVVLGAGISGLASAALLAAKGHQVTVLERNSWLGGKSRRVLVAGQRMDTGPALVTYPEVWQQFLADYTRLSGQDAAAHASLEFVKLAEVGRYYLRSHVTDLPVKPDHHWFKPWERFRKQHDSLTPAISKLLTAHPLNLSAMPALLRMAAVYKTKLTTDRYINSLSWMPQGLREVIAIHTLNAGISPRKTLALYASMTASMASQGISVPVGGVNEIPQAMARLAEAAGAEIRLNEKVTSVKRGRVTTESAEYEADLVISSLDPSVLRELLTGKPAEVAKHRSCSGVAIYAVLKQPLPENIVTHSVIMPDQPEKLYEALEQAVPPEQTMTFVNYYRAGEIYPNAKPTVAVLLTAPADGKTYDIESDWVKAELVRVSEKLKLDVNIAELFEAHTVLTPQYFGEWGAPSGALYGATRPLWQSGPFHSPRYRSPLRPWLYRVGASVHPGGGIPAVLGGVLISLRGLLRR
jgi:phytoene desaturase